MTALLGRLARRAPVVPAIVDETPVPYVSRQPNVSLFNPGNGSKQDVPGQLNLYGAVGTLFAVVSVEATAVARVDWHLYRSAASGKDEDRVEVTVHPALSVLNKPNSFMTRQELFEGGQQYTDLAGMCYWVIGYNPIAPKMPLELWPVRPDRMRAVTDPREFLVGWIYTGPNGEDIPLTRAQVLQNRMPDPNSPYYGLGPVAAIKTDAEAARYIAEWNRNFFRNSARPDGALTFKEMLHDGEFNTIVARWREQHQGVANAHRVAILEGGSTYSPMGYSQKDMEFSTLRSVSAEVILEAFAFPEFMLGRVKDVNRASAQALEAFFSKYHTRPRLDRWKGLLNNDFLPLFGPLGVGYEFDYEAPDVDDEELENQTRDSKVKAFVALLATGADPVAAVDYLDLPGDLAVITKPEPPPAPAFDPNAPQPAPGNALAYTIGQAVGAAFSAAGWHGEHDPPDGRRGRRLAVAAAADNGSGIDLSGVQRDWQAQLDELLASWSDVTAGQRAQIVEQVTAAVDANDVAALSALHVSTAEGSMLLSLAMSEIARKGAARAVDEANAQGVNTHPGHADEGLVSSVAALTAILLAQGLTNAAAREALRNYSPRARGADVAKAVDDHLRSLTDAYLHDNLGGSLSRAQMMGRLATFQLAPEASLYSSEVLDTRICTNCRAVTGKFLGLSTDTAMVDQTYPNGQYVHCLGGIRCRGQVVAVWRQETVEGGS